MAPLSPGKHPSLGGLTSQIYKNTKIPPNHRFPWWAVAPPPLSRLHGKQFGDPATKNMFFVLPSVQKVCGNRLETIFEQIEKSDFMILDHFVGTFSMYFTTGLLIWAVDPPPPPEVVGDRKSHKNCFFLHKNKVIPSNVGV